MLKCVQRFTEDSWLFRTLVVNLVGSFKKRINQSIDNLYSGRCGRSFFKVDAIKMSKLDGQETIN